MTKRLIDVFDIRIEGSRGLFYDLKNDTDFERLFKKLTGDNRDVWYVPLDIEYIFNKSGLKSISYFLELRSDYLGWQNHMVQVVKSRFYKKWLELSNTLDYDYDPLSPFNMTIKDTTDDTGSSSNNNTVSRSFSSTDTDNNRTTENQVSAYNSTDYVPQEKSIDSGSTESAGSSSTSNNSTYARNYKTDRKIERSGNIGNISSQDLIIKQRDMLMWQILDIIFNDLDSVLTTSKYIYDLDDE